MVRVDYFQYGGYLAGREVVVDRFRVVGPPATTVTNDPTFVHGNDRCYDVAVDGRQLTISRASDWSRTADMGPVIYENSYVVFGPDGWATGHLTTFAVAAALAPVVFTSFAEIHLLGLVFLSGLLAVVHWSSQNRCRSRRELAAWTFGFLLAYLLPAFVIVTPTRNYTFGPLFTGLLTLYAGGLALVALFTYPN
ncbi:hypothetical protein [Halorientalis pallida]|uniref:Uncharacterized protein n=1 Tax=Halorientalis pallida TaxID=2479928 RepID=A0A498L1R8_9EURY|nr:hypothetical protein [Halorientalis pallida]RXK51241.1 hypothetical protein EAF64_00940 [Halorientalis pallida]